MRKLVAIVSFCLIALTAFSSIALAESEREPEIVGGTEADVGEYPWMVAVGFPSGSGISHYCGGALIHEEWVLTAAHCMVGRSPANTRVVVGLHQRSNSTTEGVRRDVTQIINHPDYGGPAEDYVNDVALLKLTTPVTTIVPVRIATSAETSLNDPGNIATVIGWGRTTEGGLKSDILREVDVPLVSNATCNVPASYNSRITPEMICAGIQAGGIDACQGDSGGPMAVRDGQNEWRVVGVVSWGTGCARMDKYGVYARVSVFDEWIEGFTGPLTPTAVTLSVQDDAVTSATPIVLLAVALTAASVGTLRKRAAATRAS